MKIILKIRINHLKFKQMKNYSVFSQLANAIPVVVVGVENMKHCNRFGEYRLCSTIIPAWKTNEGKLFRADDTTVEITQGSAAWTLSSGSKFLIAGQNVLVVKKFSGDWLYMSGEIANKDYLPTIETKEAKNRRREFQGLKI